MSTSSTFSRARATEAIPLPADELPSSPEGIERALVPVFVFDTETLAILTANAAAQRLYGYSKGEFLRLTLFDLRPSEEHGRLRRFLAGGIPEGLRFTGIWRHKAKDGRIFKVSGISMKSEHAGLPACMGIVTDLTPTLHAPGVAPESERLMFPFAEQMNDVAWIRSVADHRLVYLNPAFEKVFGLPREIVYADREAVPRLLHPDDVAAFRDYRQAQGKGPAALEYRIRRPDGQERWISARSFPLVDASGEQMVAGIAKDVTARKEAERRRLEDCVAQRDALVREVHHRIKNNLQGITGMLRQFALPHPELRPAMAQAIAQVQAVAMIHGLQGKSVVDRVALCELVPGIAASLEGLMQVRCQVEIQRSQVANVSEAEAVAVALVLNELIVNAMKHAAPREAAVVRALVGGTEERAEVRILNPGRLAEGFSFAGQQGTGVGLRLVKSLLPRAGARLSVRNCAEGVESVLELEPPVVSPGTKIGGAS